MIYMPTLPTKVIQNLLARTDHRFNMTMTFRSYSAMRTNFGVFVEHYGTPIIFIDRNKKYNIGSGAFSASDRDAINSVLIVEGIDDRVHINHGKIVSEDGKDRIYGAC